MEAIHGRNAATIKDGRGRRRALALAVFTSGLLAMSAGSASAATCPSGGASITPTSYRIGGVIGLFGTTVTTMQGNVHQGDQVAASVTINSACTAGVDTTFVVYNAPSATWDPNTASRQQVSSSQTQHLSPGAHANALSITVPQGCWQIDLVQGPVINRFDPAHGVTYSAQNRLVASAGGDPGCTSVV